MSDYVRHCAKLKIQADWKYFNSLTVAAGPVAGPILDGIRDRYRVDWETVYGTEITLALDEEFRPTDHGDDRSQRFMLEPGVNYSGLPAAYIGTLDVIEISPDGKYAKIPDYKSHPSIFEADKEPYPYQSVLYPFMLMKHLPGLESVIFEYVFVRYQNCVRSKEWKRKDMPEMQGIISRGRERQRITHEHPDQAKALPCKTCMYCPLAKNFSCPIAEWNENTALTPSDWLMWKEWMRRMAAINTPRLKAIAEVNDFVEYEDGNGRKYRYGYIDTPVTCYPLERAALTLFKEHREATGEDLLDGRLNISSTKLKVLLKAKKRAVLREKFEDSIIDRSTKPQWLVRTPDEGDATDFNPYEQEEE